MPVDWSPFVEFVHRHQRFLLTTHIRPDGDGLGSMLALADALEAQGKSTLMAVASLLPQRYDFLDPDRRVESFRQPDERHRQCDAVIVLDTGTWNQLGDLGAFLRETQAEKFVIDHHLTQDDLGAHRLVDTTAEATGRLVYEAIRALDAPLEPPAASSLFVALAMDTGWFRHSNTQARSFALAGRLVEAGARPEPLHEQLFERNSLPRLKLLGKALERLQFELDGRLAWTAILRDDYQATGALPQDTEDLVNYTRSVAGVEVGVLLMEQPRGGVKVSFRSRPGVDVARIAERFGGGGHRQASGAVLDMPLEQARGRVIQAIADSFRAVS